MQNKIFLNDTITINQYVQVYIPTFKEVYENEDDYFLLAYHLTAMPFTRRAELWLNKIDYITLNFYDLFIQALYELKILSCGTDEEIIKLFGANKKRNANIFFMFFRGFNISDIQICMKTDNENGKKHYFIIDNLQRVIITENDMDKIAKAIRKILGEKRDDRKEDIGGASGRYVLDRAVTLLKRDLKKKAKNPRQYSVLESYLVTMVNNKDFKYNFETVMNIKYIEFTLSVKQILHNIHISNIAIGVYTGNVLSEKLSTKDQSCFVLEFDK